MSSVVVLYNNWLSKQYKQELLVADSKTGQHTGQVTIMSLQYNIQIWYETLQMGYLIDVHTKTESIVAPRSSGYGRRLMIKWSQVLVVSLQYYIWIHIVQTLQLRGLIDLHKKAESMEAWSSGYDRRHTPLVLIVSLQYSRCIQWQNLISSHEERPITLS